jgi:PIN domain nuclease of toxin-antitoxin system
LIVLDTHVALWWTLEPRRLGRRARQAIAEADRIGLPAIAFWEVALLYRRKRVDLGTTPAIWAREALSLPRVEALPMTPDIAIEAEALAMHRDPADRFIVATARHHQCDLLSRDTAIRDSGLVTTVW